MWKVATFAALVGASSSGLAASSDYLLQIRGVAAQDGYIFLDAQAGDLDGDGLPDDAVVRIRCGDGKLLSADYDVKAPRDLASGQASGKRTHSPVKFIKEWGPSTPQLRAMKVGYDVKKVEGTGARVTSDGWQMLSLSNTDGLCGAAQAAARLTKSRSNIQNN